MTRNLGIHYPRQRFLDVTITDISRNNRLRDYKTVTRPPGDFFRILFYVTWVRHTPERGISQKGH